MTRDPPRRDLIVIGASAGGVQVLIDLARALPYPFPGTVMIVQHIGAHRSVMPELLSSAGHNPARHPRQDETLEPGVLYIAPPDHHMLVLDDRIRLTHDAKENHARPAIDPLFRSAAISHGPRVIGTILSGRLDDGTAGLQAIKACGGMAVVQDPGDAEEPGMPGSALAHVAVDHVVTRDTLASTLLALCAQPAPTPHPAPPRTLLCEHRLTLKEGHAMDQLDEIGTRSQITCPDCSGVLWEIKGARPARYRCHTGHAYTVRSLAHAQGARTDDALWQALRAVREREGLLRDMARACAAQDAEEAARLAAEADHASTHARELQRIIAAD